MAHSDAGERFTSLGYASMETTMRYVRFSGALADDEIAALDLAS